MPRRRAKPKVKPLAIKLIGKLERIVLDDVSFQVDRSIQETKGKASISGQTELGIAEAGDGYFVAVTVSVQATGEESGSVMYSAKAKATGFYSLPEPIAPDKHEALVQQASVRSNMQVYPHVRRTLLALVGGAGFTLALPAEPEASP